MGFGLPICRSTTDRDPFDRLLIAQAFCEDLTVLTSDPRFIDYGVPVITATPVD